MSNRQLIRQSDSPTMCIDWAARGYLRHHFVRMLCATTVVFFCAVAILFTFLDACVVLGSCGSDYERGLASYVLPFLFGISFFLAASGLGIFIELLHRRLVALVGIPLLLLFGALFGAGLIHSSIGLWSGSPRAGIDGGDAGYWRWFAGFAFAFGHVALTLEFLSWAAWQLLSSQSHYLAVRGPRASPWRLFQMFSRRLALPNFLPNIRRQRLSLLGLYLLQAILSSWFPALYVVGLVVPTMHTTMAAAQLAGTAALCLLLLALFHGFGLIRWIERLTVRRTTAAYQHVRTWDKRKPIVFLRSFSQDDSVLEARTRDPMLKLVAGLTVARTLDELLLHVATPYGPVVAIGDPTEPLPPLGAARVFVSDELADWRTVVAELVAAAELVIICPNASEGVRWEIDLLVRTGAADRAIFLASPEAPALLAQELPASIGEPERSRALAYYTLGEHSRLLTTSHFDQQSYLVGLNTALREKLGKPHK